MQEYEVYAVKYGRHERRSSQIPQPAVAEQRGVISR